jgi:large subunit ribosomal protein L24
MKIRKNDQVQVIAGRDRGKKGRVLSVHPEKSRVIVEGVGMIKRHTKPNPQKNVKGGIVEREGAIHVSNVMLLDPDSSAPTRIGYTRHDDGTKSRISRKSGSVVDK